MAGQTEFHTLPRSELPSHAIVTSVGTWVTPVPCGHGDAGPQKIDAPDAGMLTEAALFAALTDINNKLLGQARGRAMTNAISALHSQVSRDGRPSRYLPEA